MELQGEFGHSDTAEYDSLQLGLLKESAVKGTYDMQVGNHLLKGKIVDLPKPLIMTEKLFNEESNEMSYVVRAVIKKKLLFASRPTPLRTG
jgi:chromosome transmission fidelity protein 8